MQLTVDELIRYTDAERARWEHWFQANGDELLDMRIAGDKETTIGELVMHVFGPELRYVQRLRGESTSNYRKLPCSMVGEVFGFGLRTRRGLREFVSQLGPEDWNRVVEFESADRRIHVTVRKTIFHILLHEIRHWAQISRLVRERGFTPPGNHDLLSSDALL